MNLGIDHDDLSVTRGIFTGCILSLIMWAGIIFMIWTLWMWLC